MAVDGISAAARPAQPRLADASMGSPRSLRPDANAARSQAAGGAAEAALSGPAVILEVGEGPEIPVPNTRDQVSLGPLTDPALSEEAAALLAARTRDLLSAYAGSISGQRSQAILSQVPV